MLGAMVDPSAEVFEAIEQVRTILQRGEVHGDLTQRGVNVSLALLAVDGLREYLRGERERAGEDFATVAEEIAHRTSLARLAAAPDDTP